MESTQQSLEKHYDDYLRQHHGGMAPLSFEMWKKAQVQCWWIHRPKTEVFRFTGTRTLLEDKLKLCEIGTRWGYYDNGVHITLGEKMSPEEHFNPINHPKHYNAHPSGIECIDITRHMNFNLGNAVKYIWRHKEKNGVEDLKKAVWYLEDEIKRLDK